MTYSNFHKHSYYSNILVPDSPVSPEDYAKRAIELGHTLLSSCEHGWQGRYIEYFELAKNYNLKFLFSTEAYIVKDRLEKDATNAHIVLMAKNENGRKSLNRILSEASLTGFYYKPRIDFNLLFSLPKDDVWITSACIGGLWKYKDEYENLFLQIQERFGKNFFFEVQNHNTQAQFELNKEIINLSNKHDIPIIFGCDSHFIYPEQSSDRDDYLLSKHISYEDEDGWYMDYPSNEDAYQRFVSQGALTEAQIKEAFYNTNLLLNVEEYESDVFRTNVKLPTLYPDKSQDERNKTFSDLVWSLWDKKKETIDVSKHPHYVEEIKKEVDTIVETNMSDYFLIDYEIVKRAKEKGGQITFTGRGSAPSFYITNLLGLTTVDRISASVKMFPERFITKERILEAKTLPDIDLNLGNPEVFAEAQSEIIGEDHSYQMIAYGTMKPKAAWKMLARARMIDFETANEVSSQIDKFELDYKHLEGEEKEALDVFDYIDEKYHKIFEMSSRYLGIVGSVTPHPCFVSGTKVFTKNGYKSIEEITTDDEVFTHNGRFRKVKALMNKNSNDVLEVKIGGQTIRATENHPFYATKTYYKGANKIIEDPKWVELKEILKNKNLYKIASPINNESIIPDIKTVPIDKETFWWIVGRYLGDGWTFKRGLKGSGDYRIVISCGKHQIDGEILKKIGEIYKFRVSEEKTAYKIYINNKNFYEFLQDFGKYSYGKKLPKFVFDLPKNLLSSLIDGYISADGHTTKKGAIGISSTSKELLLGFQQIIQKVQNKCCTIIQTRDFRTEKIEGRTVNCRPSFLLKIGAGYHSKQFYKNGYCFYNVDNIKRIEENDVEVFNLEVDEDNSYTVNNFAVHNCAYLIFNENIRDEIGLIRIKSGNTEHVCCLMDGLWAENYKFLKNDLLKVSVVELIYKVYERIGIEPLPLTDIIEKTKGDVKTWVVYKNAWTMGINQVEQTSTKGRVAKYSPRNISELSAFIAAIRPGFKSNYKKFEAREPFEYGVKTLDSLIQTKEFPQSYMLYQENAMQVLAYAGIPISVTYEVVKNIAKKRPEKVIKYKEIFLEGMTKRLIEEEKIDKENAESISHNTWQIIEDSSRYSFNACVSGSTKIQKAGSIGRFDPTIEEMFFIMNDKDYAIKTNHLDLHKKYKRCGYGNALSMYDDGKIRKNKIVNIYQSGIRKTYKVLVESGQSIVCTMNHKFPTPSGIKKLEELNVGDQLYTKGVYIKSNAKYRFTNGIFKSNIPKKGQMGFQKIPDGSTVIYNNFRRENIENKSSCSLCNKLYDSCRFEVHHIDLDETHNEYSNYQWLCVSCHKKIHYKNNRTKIFEKGIETILSKIVAIDYVCEEMVYDIEMADPAHTFVSKNGLVTSNSHSYSYAGDSLIGAYLKAHYPIEFYETILRVLEEKGDKDRMAETRLEAQSAYQITFPQPMFGQDNRTITGIKETNQITSSLTSIKGFSEALSQKLYLLSTMKFDNFLDFLVYAEENGSMSSKFEDLIKINYFQRFGNNKKLFTIFKEFTEGKSKYTKTLVAKTKEKRLSELREMFESLPNEKISIAEQIVCETIILGGIYSTYPELNKRYIYVDKVDTRYSPRIECYCLANGKKDSLKIRKPIYDGTPIFGGDIIYVDNFVQEPSVSMVNGKFVRSETDKTWWIAKYSVVTDTVDSLISKKNLI